MFETRLYHEDMRVFHLGTEALRCYYEPKVAGVSVRRDLNGTWGLIFADRYERLPEDWIAPDYDYSGADKITVPSTLQMLGYDKHQYTNVRFAIPFDPPYVPDENPAAAYMRDFEVGAEDAGKRLYLNFDGVDSCMYVWVNGDFIGYSQVSHSPSEFDITDSCHEGTNRLAVMVLKWCDGTYLEDQDKLRMTGIFRDVYILARPQAHVRDYRVQTLSIDTDAALMKLEIEVVTGNVDVVDYIMTDPEGKEVARGNITIQEGRGSAAFAVQNPALWNAEMPVLYKLTIIAAGETIEQQVGIRMIEMRDGVVYLNGTKIKFHGVNRHDSNAYTGYTISKEQVMEDMKLMKLHNINAIRTSHYPNSPWFPELCAEFGFYMIAESDIECHGVVELAGGGYEQYGLIARDERFAEAILDRVQRNVYRDKNCPAVLIWSLGNESGYGVCFEKAGHWVKDYDPGRLLQYESSIYVWHDNDPETGVWTAYDDRDLSPLDFMSRMYASTEEVREYCESPAGREKAFIQCEYCHAMGNGPGDLEDYQRLMDRYDNFSGGFIWEWCDHGVFLGKDEKGTEKFGYGGDFGEKTHDGNFCMDGLIYPDRTPHTGLLELKNVWRPVRAELLGAVPGQIRVRLTNKYNFKSTENIAVRYEITDAGAVIATGELNASPIPAGGWGAAVISADYPAGHDIYLRIIYVTMEAEGFLPEGYELGFDQVRLSDSEETDTPECKAPAPTYIKTSAKPDIYLIEGQGFSYEFSVGALAFTSMKVEGKEILETPMEWNIHRAPTDNDIQIKNKWSYQLGYDRTFMKRYGYDINTVGNQVVIHVLGAITAVAIRPLYKLDVVYRIDGAGHVDMEVHGNRGANLPWFPRLGLKMQVKKAMDRVSYLGYGPYENYPDKHRADYYGAFDTTVDEMYEPYIRPQENGHRWNCNRMSVSDGEVTLEFSGRQPFGFNASRYTTLELMRAAHRTELEEAEGNEICVDYRMSGVGSNSCGPELLPQYRFDDESFSWHIGFGARKA